MSMGPGRRPVDHQGRQEQGHHDVGGDSQGEKRDHGPEGRRVVGRLRAGHPLDGALAELLRVLRDILFSMA